MYTLKDSKWIGQNGEKLTLYDLAECVGVGTEYVLRTKANHDLTQEDSEQLKKNSTDTVEEDCCKSLLFKALEEGGMLAMMI
ncbi:hypothetical protein FACS1894113_1150 [Alphaproteobacteria bacterium]|nr:hypothetical protein FACS1894113_1150 [Alphaproteobacteria bacterium]